MNKFLCFLLLIFTSNILFADDTPDINAEGMKKVYGIVSKIESVDRSQRGAATLGIPVFDFIESIYGNNYEGFPIYYVKINEEISLEVGSHKSFKIGECVLVWYDQGMGNTPNLSMPGQGGISKSNECKS
jgi:hypothetical protein